LGVNTPLYPLAYRLLPALGWLRVPPRALLLVALSASALAAYGADALLAGVQAPGARSRATLAAFGALLACAGLGLGYVWLYATIPPALVLLSGAGAATSLVFCLSLQPRVPRPAVQVLLAATLIADLGAVGHSLLELRPEQAVLREGLAPATWVAAHQPPVQGPYRVYSPSLSIPQHTGARLGLEQVDGVDPIQLRWVAHYVGLAGDRPAAGYGVTMPYIPDGADPGSAGRGAVPNARMLGLLNACYVVADDSLHAPGLTLAVRADGSLIYQNEHCLPRAFVMARTEPASSWQDAQARLTGGHDPAHSALVTSATDADERALNGPPGWQPAEVVERSPDHLIVQAEAKHPALLVLGEIWYPGWQVLVDGVARPIVQTYGLLRGVYLNPGKHTVVWRYRPASLRWGALVTLAALAAWLLTIGVPALVRLKHQERTE
jgi:hypothetical protein